MDQQQILLQRVSKVTAEADWGTLDWITLNDIASKKAISRHDDARPRSSFSSEAREALSSNQGFLSAVVVGLILGILGVVSDASSHWVSSFRSGICVGYFWLPPSLCCVQEEECENFISWGEFFNGKGNRVAGFTNFAFYICFSIVAATTASFFCKVYAPYAAGGGINEVKTIVSGYNVRRYLGGLTLLTKTIGMCFSTGSGIVVGKEGPFVHIGACVGELVSRFFPMYRLEAKKRELITAGAAAGLAVAFGAPVGGVIFALEEISSFYNFKAMLQSLVAGVVAVLVQSRIDLWHTGRIVQFSINYRHTWHFFELPAFALIGVFCGLAGSLFNEINIRIIRWRKANIKQWRVTEVAVVMFVTAIFNFYTPFAHGGLLELLGDSFQDCTSSSKMEMCKYDDLTTLVYLIICATVKLALFMFAVGTYLPAGILVPSLAIGAVYGRAFGIFFQALEKTYDGSYIFMECKGEQTCVVPGAYAIVGAAAFLTGVSRMSICLAVIMFELTGSLTYLVPVIIGILSAKWAGEAIGVEGTYEIMIEENKLPFLDPKKEFNHCATAEEVVGGKKFTTLTAQGLTLDALLNIMAAVGTTGFPVVDNHDRMTLLGYVTRKNLCNAIREAAMCDRRASERSLVRFARTESQSEHLTPRTTPVDLHELNFTNVVESSMIQVEPQCSVAKILYLFKSLGVRHVMVSKLSRFQGFISKKDFISFMRKIEHEEHEEEAALVKNK
jgi:chloride channel 3/4/5